MTKCREMHCVCNVPSYTTCRLLIHHTTTESIITKYTAEIIALVMGEAQWVVLQVFDLSGGGLTGPHWLTTPLLATVKFGLGVGFHPPGLHSLLLSSVSNC